MHLGFTMALELLVKLGYIDMSGFPCGISLNNICLIFSFISLISDTVLNSNIQSQNIELKYTKDCCMN